MQYGLQCPSRPIHSPNPFGTYTYDNNGNTLSKTDTNGTTQYAWDVENRLTTVTLPNNGREVTFKYDPFGRRIQKSSAAGTTIYVYDGVNIVGEYDAAGNLVARYAQGTGIDEPLAMWRGGQVGYYNADGLGSVTSIIDSTLTPLATYTYDSFGKKLSTGGSVTNPFQYTGREWDSETGLYSYRARYHEPQTGRFISEDPIRFGGGINFYRYVENNPVNRRDPFGLCSIGDFISCYYNGAKCFNQGTQCRKDLDKEYPDPADLCAATDSPYLSSAYVKVCFARIPSCQKALQACTRCGVSPPFNQTNIGNGPPKNIGPKKDPPTPVQYPPDFPGRPQNDPLNDPFAVPK